jgi:ankyrin repeat protein
VTGNETTVRLLLGSGADPDLTGGRKNTPLMEAIQKRDLLMVRILVEGGAGVNVVNPRGLTPLGYAAQSNDVEIAGYLIRSGADVSREYQAEVLNTTNRIGSTALLESVKLDRIAMASFLLERGADPNLPSENLSSATALGEASAKGNGEMVSLLLDYGASVDSVGLTGFTALDYAALFGQAKIAQQLLSASAHPGGIHRVLLDDGSYGRYTTLAIAVSGPEGKRAEIVELLLDHGADPSTEVSDRHGRYTPLHVAAFNGDRKSAGLLLAFGADPKAVNSVGNSPAQHARQWKNVALARFLESSSRVDRDRRRVPKSRTARDVAISAEDDQPPGSGSLSSSAPRPVRANDRNAPVIEVVDRIQVGQKSGTVVVRGRIQDESEIASFTIEGQEVELLSSGRFEYSRYIRPGEERKIEILAIDAAGNRSLRTVIAKRSDQLAAEKIAFDELDPNRSEPGQRKKSAVALVIGVEDYKRVPDARYARADASVFRDYASRVLGVPRSRIVTRIDSDADKIGMRDAVRRLRGLVEPDTDLYVYFAGHGFASGEGVPYLLPYDGDARYLEEFSSRTELFDSLASLGPASTTVFLDTCYSGQGREGTQLASGMRPLVIARSDAGVPEGFTVISAATASEFSGDLPEAKHGLFSYFLMRGLGGAADQNGDRAITVVELHEYLAGEVGRQAARLGRQQTPELFGDRERVLVRY